MLPVLIALALTVPPARAVRFETKKITDFELSFEKVPRAPEATPDPEFARIFEQYAQISCEISPDRLGPLQIRDLNLPTRPPSAKESAAMTECFTQPRFWRSLLTLLGWRKAPPRPEMCTTFVLKPNNIKVNCDASFKRLGMASVFNDVLVIKAGDQVIRGAGGDAHTYIVAPEFHDKIDLREHGEVFHLKSHQCLSPDVFHGCIEVHP